MLISQYTNDGHCHSNTVECVLQYPIHLYPNIINLSIIIIMNI